MQSIGGNDINDISRTMTSMNPVLPLESKLLGVRFHENASKKEALSRATEMLRLVKIAEPEKRVNDYPHRLSGV